MKKTEAHFDAIRKQDLMLRAKPFDLASVPWEGDSISLEHALVEMQARWPLSAPGITVAQDAPCPEIYSAERAQGCRKMAKEQEEVQQEIEEMREVISTDSIGWVENDNTLNTLVHGEIRSRLDFWPSAKPRRNGSPSWSTSRLTITMSELCDEESSMIATFFIEVQLSAVDAFRAPAYENTKISSFLGMESH